MAYSTTVTQKGQVTIPVKFRKRLGLSRGKRVRFVDNPSNAQELILRPVKDFLALKGTFKTTKRYSKKAARKAIITDIVAGKV